MLCEALLLRHGDRPAHFLLIRHPLDSVVELRDIDHRVGGGHAEAVIVLRRPHNTVHDVILLHSRPGHERIEGAAARLIQLRRRCRGCERFAVTESGQLRGAAAAVPLDAINTRLVQVQVHFHARHIVPHSILDLSDTATCFDGDRHFQHSPFDHADSAACHHCNLRNGHWRAVVVGDGILRFRPGTFFIAPAGDGIGIGEAGHQTARQLVVVQGRSLVARTQHHARLVGRLE